VPDADQAEGEAGEDRLEGGEASPAYRLAASREVFSAGPLAGFGGLHLLLRERTVTLYCRIAEADRHREATSPEGERRLSKRGFRLPAG